MYKGLPFFKMAKFIYTLIIILTILTIESKSVTVVNNVTVPSDVLQQLFYNKVQYNLKLSPADTIQKIKCVTSLMEIVSRIPSLKVLPFIDSWASIPSGILKLHFVSIGNFDQCLDISVDFNNSLGVVNGQHCFASIPLVTEESLATLFPESMINGESIEGAIDFLKLKIGICVPDTCTEDILTDIFQKSLATAFKGALSGISIGGCNVAKKADLESPEIAGITILSIFGGFVVMSSLYDLLMRLFKKSPKTLLLSFSIFANGKKLFAINTKKSPNCINCLSGIRVFSMAWVLYGHNYLYLVIVPLINSFDLFHWFKKASSLHVLNATVSVDSFLFISGLLVAWLGFRELDKTKGKLNVVMMYVHRYIRLTPPVAGVIIFLLSGYKLLINGPFQKAFIGANDQCTNNWWVTLLYIQNYFRSETICVPQTWYLALDFHLYILSPLLLIPLWKWGKKFSPVLVFLGLLSIGCVMGTFFTQGYNDFQGIINQERMKKVYFPTHTRYAPWLVGLGLGYFMHVNRQRTFKPSKLLQLLCWTVSLSTIVVIIFGTYFSMHSDKPTTVFEATMYESLKRVAWSIALAWIVFACHFGFGGLVNTFLAHPFWQPLSRLTYSLYLVHMAILGINYGATRTDSYFSDYNAVLTFWSSFGISLLAAVALTFTFEAPVLVLETALFGREGTKKNENIRDNAEIVTKVPYNNKVP